MPANPQPRFPITKVRAGFGSSVTRLSEARVFNHTELFFLIMIC